MAEFYPNNDDWKSSNIRSARYNPETQVLEIDFWNKRCITSTYAYQSFSPMDWADFQAAESKGKHFAYNIRNKRDAQGDPAYPAKRIK